MNIAFGTVGTMCSIAIGMNPNVSTAARASRRFTCGLNEICRRMKSMASSRSPCPPTKVRKKRFRIAFINATSRVPLVTFSGNTCVVFLCLNHTDWTRGPSHSGMLLPSCTTYECPYPVVLYTHTFGEGLR